ncbi:MAG: hypothetical protein ABSG93_01465 [Solirubrobacteraceae bacterium]|jgi:hypothetical protein
MSEPRNTREVSEEVFRAVYDSPASLPGEHRWLTPDEDVRKLESLLGMPSRTIGAPLWLSGESPDCANCGRRISWLDIVSSALQRIHDRAMIASVILGERKFVNTEAPAAIPGVMCFECGATIEDLRSFKCHNWAYAREAMLEVLELVSAREAGTSS